MTRENFTAVGLIVDRSGSMQEIRADAEGGVNAFIDAQKPFDGQVVLSLTEFDTYVDVRENLTPIANVRPYTLQPRGNTALYDAVGKTVVNMGEQLAAMDEAERPSKVIIVIVTDGFENSSQEWTRNMISELVQRQEAEFGWEFLYLSASPDAFADGRRMGISRAHTHSVPSDPGGMSASYAQAARTVSTYHTTGAVIPPEPAKDPNA